MGLRLGIWPAIRSCLRSGTVRRLDGAAAAAPLAARHLEHCRVVTDRLQLLEMLPQGAEAAEVGVLHGDFSEEILRRTKPRRLHLIDIRRWWGDRFAHESRVTEHVGDSSTMLRQLSDASLDWVYIDADHNYDGVKRDIAAALLKVKPSGWLVFNDYTPFDPYAGVPIGVPRAVNELCLEEGWEIVCLALHPMGFHDVALRKIE